MKLDSSVRIAIRLQSGQ